MKELAGTTLIILAVLWPAIAYYYAYELKNEQWAIGVTVLAIGIIGVGVLELSERVEPSYARAFTVVGYIVFVGAVFGYHKLWFARIAEREEEIKRSNEE